MKHFSYSTVLPSFSGVGNIIKHFLLNIYVTNDEMRILNFFLLTSPWPWIMLNKTFKQTELD